jgi:hypothetical protein
MRVVEEHSKQGTNIDAVRAAKDDAMRDADGPQSGKQRRADAMAAQRRLKQIVTEEKQAVEEFQVARAIYERVHLNVTREVVLNPLRDEEDEPFFKLRMDDADDFDADALDAEDQEGVLEEMAAITLGLDTACLESIKRAQHNLENPEHPMPGPNHEEAEASDAHDRDVRTRLEAFRARAPVTAEKYFGPEPEDDHYHSATERADAACDRLEAALKAYRVTVKETVPNLSVVADEYDGPPQSKRRRTAADPDAPLTAEQQEKKDAAEAKKARDKKVRDELKVLMESDAAEELRKQKEQAWKEAYAEKHGEPCVAYDPKKTQADWEGFDPSVTIREVMDAQREEEDEEYEGEGGDEEDEEDEEEAGAAEAEEPTVLASEYEEYRQRKQAQLSLYNQFLKEHNLTAQFKAYRKARAVVSE